MAAPISLAVPLAQVAYAAASITNSYTLAGSFTSGVAMMMIVSTLDQPVQISFNGTTDHLAVPVGSTVPVFIPLNFESNLMQMSAPAIFVKEIGNPTTGSLYVTAFAKS